MRNVQFYQLYADVLIGWTIKILKINTRTKCRRNELLGMEQRCHNIH